MPFSRAFSPGGKIFDNWKRYIEPGSLEQFNPEQLQAL